MIQISEEEVSLIRERFPAGCRITLDQTGDGLFPILEGAEGTVQKVDDRGIVHVLFDGGIRLGLVPGKDRFLISESYKREQILSGLDLSRDAFFFDPGTRFVMEVFFEPDYSGEGQFVCSCLPFEEILAAGRKAGGDPAEFFRLLDDAAYRESVKTDGEIAFLREAAEVMQEPADYLGRTEATMRCLLSDTAAVMEQIRTPDRSGPARQEEPYAESCYEHSGV